MKLDEIILGDCLVEMKKMEDCCIDLTVTSPPYDNLREYLGHSLFDFQGIARELYRITKVGGVVVWVVADSTIDGSETGQSFQQALFFRAIGFNMETMIYRKTCYPRSGSLLFYQSAFEFMFLFMKGNPKTFNPIVDRKNKKAGVCSTGTKREANGSLSRYDFKVNEQKQRDNVWDYDPGFMKGTKDTIAHQHPAIFPEALAADHILSWSNLGDTVLDCFAGSGTTCKMAKLHNRHFIGIEINPEYVEICNKRLSQEVFDFG